MLMRLPSDPPVPSLRNSTIAPSARALLAAALLLAAPAMPLLAAPPPGVFTVTPDTIRADTTGAWRAGVRLRNTGEWGLYPDSLNLEWRSSDTEPSAAPRQGVSSLTALVSVLVPAGAGETTGMDWTAPAEFERGVLTFRLYAHDVKKQAFAFEANVVVAGSELFDRHPVTLLGSGDRQVEVVHVPAAATPAPGVLYVPPAGVTARNALRWAQHLSTRGFCVEVVSLPGTGRSSGVSDRAGPASVAAVDAALGDLAKRPGVDGKRLAVWGLGDGASSALLSAVRHPELLAVVAQNADYDPWSTFRALGTSDQEAFVRAVGRDSSGWRARAPGLVAARVTSPVLVLHSARQGAASIAAAEAFVLARAAKDLPGETRIEGGTIAGTPAGPRRDATRLAMEFLTRHLRTP